MKPRLTDVEFEELKCQRDAALSDAIDKICAEQGWDRATTAVHAARLRPITT
jgi:hypothetical protein